MATVVLGAVGGLIGGPIGAALGALIGNQVDQVVFAPKGRDGPRLADLKVQVSTYGQQIPKLFGTMRVAGSVIWATDLIESRTEHGGGKGQPKVTEFSYSASLAVALSARAIRDVRRIWADGNLLRGSDGALYEPASLRLYHGGEDQMVDPLIAAAVGPQSASAFRGLAYVVLEGLELGAFGNRIPSLTFEVVADEGGMDSGTIGNVLMNEAVRCEGQWPIAGYAASGARLRDAMEPLFAADQVGLLSGGGAWRLAPAAKIGPAAALQSFARAGRAAMAQDIQERRRRSLAGLPGAIRLRHYEPERDYQAGQQSSLVVGGGAREQAIDLPAVLPAASARSLAAWLAAAASDGRETLVWQGDFAAFALPIGGLVTLPDGGRWRVAGRTIRDQGISVELARHQRQAPPELGAEPGVALPAPDWPVSEGVVRVLDVPNMDNLPAHVPRILLAAAGSGERWRGADCWFVGGVDEPPIALGRLRGAKALGALIEPLGEGSRVCLDYFQGARVRLANTVMALQSVDMARLMAGANQAMIGGEWIQFGQAELEQGEGSDGRTWRLSALIRSRDGQSGAGGHEAGAPFVLLDDAVLSLLPDSLAMRALGGTAQIQWAERGQTDMTQVAIPSGMAAMRPLSPVHGRAEPDGVGGLRLSWVRRSRMNSGWRDEVDLPLGEGAEKWRISLSPEVEGAGPWEVGEAHLHLDAAIVAQLPQGGEAKIAQSGDHGLSPALIITLT